MSSILKVNTLTGVSTAGSISVTAEGNSTTTNLQGGLAKAWVTIETEDGTNTILDSLNVSDQTDNGTGDFTIEFGNNFANIHYCSTGTSSPNGNTNCYTLQPNRIGTNGLYSAPTTGEKRYNTSRNNSADDSEHGYVVEHGDLA
tara:strand:- start:546 stop:977 length:432 start_codon:yes stop_codon:yes gene_type:complete